MIGLRPRSSRLARRAKQFLSSRAPKLRSEELESRRMLAFDPSGMEQEMMEHLNRMRMNPADELEVLFLSTTSGDPDYFTSPDADVNLALGFFGTDDATLFSQWTSLTAAAPVAWNEDLYDAAEGHNNEMIAQNTQSHQLPGEDSLLNRAINEGYGGGGGLSVGENVFAYTESVFHGHSAFAIDWGNTPTGIQDPAGHRINMMNSSWQEVGISIVESTPANLGDVGPLVVTQDFGSRTNYGNPRALGVVYTDSDADGLYDAGEGESGITITLTDGSTTVMTTTMTAGGWQVEVAAGTYDVTASGGSLTGTVDMGSVTIGSENVKVDLETTSIPQQATLSGTIFADNNDNGAQDSGELGLSGVNVFLDLDGDGVLDGGETSTSTASDGTYSFDVPSGVAYDVTVELPTGYEIGADGSASTSVTPNAGGSEVINFGLFQMYAESGSTVTIRGTTGDDVATFSVGATTLDVTLNSDSWSLDLSTYDTIIVDGIGGTDTLDVTGTTGDETATINPTTMTFVGTGFDFTGDSFEAITVDLVSGTSDEAYVYDDAGDDDLISHPTWGRLISDDYNFYVENFDRLYTYATAGGNDRAYVYDGPTDDRYIGRTDYSIIRGNNFEFYTRMEGFERNFAYSTQGGEDYAFFYDSASDDNFFGLDTYAVMQDPAVTYFNYASGFVRNFAYATAGGTDNAYLTDSTSDDRFYGRETFSILRGANYEFFNQAEQFENVYAYATRGGTDHAVIYDGAGDDVLRMFDDYSTLTGAGGFFYNAREFEQVVAYANNGGNDLAYFTDSTGDDTFFGRNGYGYLSGTGFFNRADNFDEIEADGSNGGTNTLNTDALDYVFSTTGSWV